MLFPVPKVGSLSITALHSARYSSPMSWMVAAFLPGSAPASPPPPSLAPHGFICLSGPPCDAFSTLQTPLVLSDSLETGWVVLPSCPPGSFSQCHSVLLIVFYVGHRLPHPTLHFFSWNSHPSLDLANASSCLESHDATYSEAFSESTVLCLPTLPCVRLHIHSLRLCLLCHMVSTGQELLLFWPQCIPAGPELNM